MPKVIIRREKIQVHCPKSNQNFRDITWNVQCDKSIWMPGNILRYSWEHYQLYTVAGKYIPSSNPCYSTVFPIYIRELFQLWVPCNCWYISQVQPGHCHRFSLGIVPAFYEVQERTLLVKNGKLYSIQFESVVVGARACLRPVRAWIRSSLGTIFFFYTTASYDNNIIIIFWYYDYIK